MGDSIMTMNTILHANCIEGMKRLPDESVSCTVTSPPYGQMRDYGGAVEAYDFPAIANQLARITAPGGVICWVVRNQVHQGAENCQAEEEKLFFVKQCGLIANHTIIGIPHGSPFKNRRNRRYACHADFIYVFSKGLPRTVNLITDVRNKTAGNVFTNRLVRRVDGSDRLETHIEYEVAEFGLRTNVWHYTVGRAASSDPISRKHPARMPESLAEDLIISFSKPNDVVFDPMAGSGTTLNEEFVGIIHRRLRYAKNKQQPQRVAEFLRRFAG
jgi:site-specific DNA-methyltransferase (adenine-specific)